MQTRVTTSSVAAGSTGTPQASIDLLADASVEMTAREIPALEQAASTIPAGTQVNVTFLPGEQYADRARAAALVRSNGLVPVPHLSARRIESEAELRGYLELLRKDAQIDRAFVVAGDPAQPVGPYDSSLAIIRQGLLAEYGIRKIGIGGYPTGHPQIADAILWQALHDKHKVLTEQGHEYEITTQFGFESEPILAWLERLRQEGITAPVRIGVVGPTSVRTLLRYAAACGVGTSARMLKRYGVSITRLFDTAGPGPLLNELKAGLDPARHGEVKLHFFPFGKIEESARWIIEHRNEFT